MLPRTRTSSGEPAALCEDRYELIDFGEGRKLESLAGHWVDRPSPAASGIRKFSPELWRNASSFFDPSTKTWNHRAVWPPGLAVDCASGRFRMPLRPTPFGHIGLFPEQSPNWNYLAEPPPTGVAAATAASDSEPEGLNLFGYTGASTLAMVAGGLRVTHVDSAKPNVQAAREAAKLNGWDSRPIRYIVDDSGEFAARENRRNRQYHTIVLDPPAYGHGPSGKSWRIERDLWPLLESCFTLLRPDSFRLLISGHSRRMDESDVHRYLKQCRFIRQHGDSSGLRTDCGRSQLKDRFGRTLDAGFYVRIDRRES